MESRKPAPPGSKSSSPPDPGESGSGITALVVDDEEIIRKTAKMVLERRGYKVLLAGSGAEAIEVLRAHEGAVSIAVLDLSMPGLTGEETLPQLLAIQPGLQVLISSGYRDADVLERFKGLPLAGIVQKPYTAAQLADKVRDALEEAGRKKEDSV